MSDLLVRNQATVLNIAIEAIDTEAALIHIQDALHLNCRGYVCFANVHGIMEAQRSAELAATYANAFLTLPDGMPLAWVGRAQGHKRMARVAGPELMLEIFKRPEFESYTHYLCGGKNGVAEDLRSQLERRFPRASIVGTYTPPFSELSLSGGEAFINQVQQTKPDIVWVGISTPKQERFMRRFLPHLDTTLMFGVGAAFDFHTGRIHDSPDWVKVGGLQWVHRLLQDPKHLWKRHLRNNPVFLHRIAMQFAGSARYATSNKAVTPLHSRADAHLLRKTGSEV